MSQALDTSQVCASRTIRTRSARATAALGRRIGEHARAGDLVLLRGDLGTGKTCLAQGIARGLGITEPVASPTFTLVNLYRGRLPMYHVDLYRIDSPEEAEDLGLGEIMLGEGIVVVEWPERAEDLWEPARLDIFLLRTGERTREVTVRALGQRYAGLLRQVTEDCYATGD